ncbi:hypothetical protein [Micromonospora sp. C95]|uniref:hypothetical protein n=1 Tax=Micromonospora sp. C95 TaxID=2824882 RepID=UPI001B3961C4|nr:hypothetical protein [Micromonospora sp. C95]MBQ1027870.1 hypothetical protein [Micromonospora sp. C95]
MARFWWALPWLLAVLLVPFGSAGPATAAPEETGRYYVVGPPVDGQREYLYSIALVTLGNGNRFREIIELNRGREQPDGATFTDGVELGPGWILVLPPDADGPGVRTGALPAIGPPTPRPSRSAAAPTPSTAAPSPTTPQPPPSADPTTPTDSPATVAVAPPSESGSGLSSANLVRIGAAALAVLLATVALLVLPRRRHQLRSVGLDDGPWPPERHHTPTPAERAALATDTPSTAPAAPADPSQPPPAADPALAPPPPSAPPPPAPSSVAPGRSPAPPSPAPAPPPAAAPPTAVPPASPSPAPVPVEPTAPPAGEAGPSAPPTPQAEPGSSPSAAPPDWPPFAGTSPTPAPPSPVTVEWPDIPGDNGAMGRVDLPRPTLPADGDVPYVRSEVRTEVGSVMVRLIGVTTGPSTPAYAWLADDEPAPEATVPLVLGRQGPWRLQVDLGRAPDVFTLVGDLDECRRLAVAYARQLHADGIAVGVVGDALGAETFAGCRRLARLPEPAELDSDRYVVITAGLPSGAGIRGLAAATAGRCVPVVIGPVPDGRWSAQLGAGV